MYFKVFWQRQAENLPSRCVRRLLVQLLKAPKSGDGTFGTASALLFTPNIRRQKIMLVRATSTVGVSRHPRPV